MLMNESAAKILIGTAPYSEAQALKRKLEVHAISVVLTHNQATCGGGCSVKLEIWSHADDVVAITKILAAERHNELAMMGYDPKLATEVFDTSRAEATCPCCGTSFATQLSECPECGLCFGVPDKSPKKGCGTC